MSDSFEEQEEYGGLEALLHDAVDGYALDIAEQIKLIADHYQRQGAKAYWNGDLFGVHYARGGRDAALNIARVMREAVMAARARARAREENH